MFSSQKGAFGSDGALPSAHRPFTSGKLSPPVVASVQPPIKQQLPSPMNIRVRQLRDSIVLIGGTNISLKEMKRSCYETSVITNIPASISLSTIHRRSS